jgi:hypothetical protein
MENVLIVDLSVSKTAKAGFSGEKLHFFVSHKLNESALYIKVYTSTFAFVLVALHCFPLNNIKFFYTITV